MKDKLYIIDVAKFTEEMGEDTVLRYDLIKIIVAVQGQVNREDPELYLMWVPQDPFWLDYMQEEGKFLHGRERVELPDWAAFIERYGSLIKECGLAVWDYDVPATVNAATTACGIEGYIPVRGGSEAMARIMRETGAEVKLDLVGKFTGKGRIWDTDRESTGSAKCDTYIWAMEKYMDKCHPTILFYTLDGISWDDNKPYYPDLDNACVFNHDYAISKRAFIFDVSSYDDELPCDDLTQPLGTDYKTMQEIFLRHYNLTGGRMTTVCGFNPWHVKYTTHKGKGKHDPVPSEWRFGEVLSAYNCVKDADAYGRCGLANASVFTHFPLKEKYENRKADPTKVYDPNKTYIMFYVGDYDAAAWTARSIPEWYEDPKLGKNPLMWCFNPNLSDRIPQAFDFIYERYTQNDYFEAGDSGAGYNNPALLYEPRPHSGLPSGVAENIRHNKYYFDKFDMGVIGFIINGDYNTDEQQMQDLAEFAKLGSTYTMGRPETSIVNGAVYMPMSAWGVSMKNSPTIEECAKSALHGIDRFPKEKKFHVLRTICASPTRHDEILAEMKRQRPEANIELVDPHTFFAFAKYAVENGLTY